MPSIRLRLPVEPRHCQLVGLVGSAALAAGGASAGALPVREVLDPGSGRAALGLVGVYFGLVLLIAAWWMLGRAVRGPGPPSPRTLLLTLALWAAPLVVAPPLFSRDVYSYVAQGAMVDAQLDVYAYGPSRLGGPLTAEVAPLWRDTPTPYGPVFLACASAVAGVTRAQMSTGVFGMRLVALLGLGLMAAALPRLARHCGADPAAALWLGALNPLVLLHLVAGAHNDAVMLGLMGTGLVAALGGRPVPATVLVTLAALVKAPAALGLVAVALIWARSIGTTGVPTSWPRTTPGSARDRRSALSGPPLRTLPARLLLRLLRLLLLRLAPLRPVRTSRMPPAPTTLRTPRTLLTLRARFPRLTAGLAVLGVCAATTTATTALTGTGYGWLAALDTPVSPGNWSLTSTLGRMTTTLLKDAGSALAPLAAPTWHLLGLAATALATLLAWRRHHALRPVYALGLSLTAVALLGPAIRPWYVLWGLFLIAAAGPVRSVRRSAAAASGVLALAVLPSGFAPDGAQLTQAVSGGLLAVAALWCAHRIARRPAHRPLGSTA
ncbi:polyprenol phosphomannose-dependent alpha 1,6 mannosyltransferase MptB [Streptomyces sp. NPDC002187]|uniref:polyprenol phosphomannose-dependent alpha 1,6 mannosyltransferase MptB n=1 Tax=Streptomyces sp. NPDC002187 TaxID=3364637 RepID=UPI0036B71EB2